MFCFLILLILQGGASGLQKNNFLGYVQESVDNVKRHISEKCMAHIEMCSSELNNSKIWDLESRMPRGLIKDNGMDNCVELCEKNEENDGTLGQYCYLSLIVPLNFTNVTDGITSDKNLDKTRPNQGYAIATYGSDINNELLSHMVLVACLPDSCYDRELLRQLSLDAKCVAVREETYSSSLDASDIVFIVFFSTTVLLMVLSTAYDIYTQKLHKESVHNAFLAFSIYSNGKKILKASSEPGQILCFNGMKAISLFWVIVGHRYSMFESLGIIDSSVIQEWKDRWYAAYILAGHLAVDTFLFVTGALLVHLFLKSMKKPNAKFNVVLYYVHRYLRLTAPLLVLWFFVVTVLRRLGTNPQTMEYFRKICLDNWWQLFLYVHNYFPFDQRCLSYTWYISVDMQLFIFSPFLLIPLVRYPKLTRNMGLPLIILASIVCTIVIIFLYDIRLFSESSEEHYYYKTYTRAGPWLIGIAFGALFLDQNMVKRTYYLNQVVSLAIWGIVLAILGVIIFTQRIVINNDSRIESTIYIGLQRPLWALCLCWISFACIYGHGGVINKFLSLQLFQAVSRISYSTYLVHMLVILMNMRIQRILTDADDAIYLVFVDIILALAVGAFWTIAFESPFVALEAIILGGGIRKHTERKIGQPEESATNNFHFPREGLDGSSCNDRDVEDNQRESV